jgi:transcriptional regulator with XRE-family HTH domain
MPSYNYMAENGLPFAKVFGERIRQRRKEMGFSQGDLFEKTSISTAYISSVERGTANPSLDIMVQLCVALECSIADMLRPEGID